MQGANISPTMSHFEWMKFVRVIGSLAATVGGWGSGDMMEFVEVAPNPWLQVWGNEYEYYDARPSVTQRRTHR